MPFDDHGRSAPRTRPLTLGLLTPHNVYDRQAFSGTAFHAARALARTKGVALRLLGDHHRPPGIGTRVGRRIFRRRRAATTPMAGDLAGLDAVIGLVASELLDHLPAGLPYLHVTDATPGFLAEAYGQDIPPEAYTREARVARRAARCLYSSDAMAARARRELGIAEAASVPFGINLDPAPETARSPLRPVELLFVGADWTRKGGDIALAALAHLRALGFPAHLTLVGHIPSYAERVPGVTVAGFLDKTRPAHARRLADLYARAHLMILPTRGDCTPMVIAEAMAHGTPVLATETGGIPEMIGKAAGRTLALEAGPEDWAAAIVDMTRDRQAYLFMSDAARDRARTCFSWDVWAARVVSAAAHHCVPSLRAA